MNELPQLLHVLSGRMALIGPRPDISAVMDIYRGISPAANLRLTVRPGLTGWAKVNSGRLEERAENLEYDLYWLSHRSIPLDIEIIFKTAMVMFTGHGGG